MICVTEAAAAGVPACLLVLHESQLPWKEMRTGQYANPLHDREPLLYSPIFDDLRARERLHLYFHEVMIKKVPVCLYWRNQYVFEHQGSRSRPACP